MRIKGNSMIWEDLIWVDKDFLGFLDLVIEDKV